MRFSRAANSYSAVLRFTGRLLSSRDFQQPARRRFIPIALAFEVVLAVTYEFEQSSCLYGRLVQESVPLHPPLPLNEPEAE